MVKDVSDGLETEAEIVFGAIEREILLCGPGHIVGEERARVGVVEEIRVAAGDDHEGSAAVADILAIAVGAGDTQVARDEIAVVEAGDRLPLAGAAAETGPEEARGEDI